MIIAISVLGLMSMLSLGLVRLIGVQINRTRVLSYQAQVEQLLISGATSSAQIVVDWQLTDRNRTYAMDLPPELTARKAAVSMWVEQTIADIERVAHVEVLLDGQAQRQALRYVRDARGWALVEARLGE